MQTEDIVKPNCYLMKLKVKPLFFLSGSFKKTQLKWHIGQKEIYPIIYALKRFDDFLVPPNKNLVIFNDHASLKFVLNPSRVKNLNHLNRLNRCGITIQRVITRVISISSKEKVFADLLTRWGYIKEVIEMTKQNGEMEVQNIQDKTEMKIVEKKTKVDIFEEEAQDIVQSYEDVISKTFYLEQCENKGDNEDIGAFNVELRNLQHEQMDNFKMEDVSFLNPYYSGDFKTITEAIILKYQKLFLDEDPKGNVLL